MFSVNVMVMGSVHLPSWVGPLLGSIDQQGLVQLLDCDPIVLAARPCHT